jgi:hypothetical protein
MRSPNVRVVDMAPEADDNQVPSAARLDDPESSAQPVEK